MTNTNMEIFKNEEFGSVRVVVIDNDPWFVGRDVATALGYANTKDALAKHVDHEDILDSAVNGVIVLGVAFLISPYGLPMLAAWLIAQLHGLRYAIQDAVYG